MELWIVRHAIAEDRSIGGDDPRRALTREGRERFERGVRGLARIGARFDRLLHSPLLRAQETADLLAPLVDGETEVTRHLACEPDVELLALFARHERAAVVGHEPWLSQLAAWLVLGWRVYQDDPAHQPFEIKKGAALQLSGAPQPGAMRLVAAYPPAALRALGRH